MTTKITKKPYTPPAVTSMSQRAIIEGARLITKFNPNITRRTIELQELLMLSPYATPSANSLGRVRPEEEGIRTVFARDCDRILHMKAFEALDGKTQVFIFPRSPHIHNRRFHTDKVISIAKTIGRYLGLNLDLIEAIAKGHDLGHTPFGHTGEEALSAISQRVLGRPFKHNLHSLRVIDVLEKNGNLTFEVRDGIVRHLGERLDPILYPSEKPSDIANLNDEGFPCTLEGCVVRISDIIAYLAHDFSDALDLEIINQNDLPKIVEKVLGETFDSMINVMVLSVINASRGKNHITMEDDVLEARKALYELVEVKKIIGNKKVKASRVMVPDIIETLFYHYTKKDDPQAAIDKIASLTDKQARNKYYKVKGKSEVARLILSNKRLSLINELHETLDKAEDLPELYKNVMDGMPSLFEGSEPSVSIRSSSIMLFDEEKGGLRIEASRGIRKETVRGQTIEPDEGISGRVFASGEPILVEDAAQDTKTPAERSGSFMCVPITTFEGEALGVLTVRSDQVNVFKGEDLRHLEKISKVLAHKISRTREGALDGLTGLYNHKKGEARLKIMVEQAKEQNLPLSLIVLDIDHFKHTNDTYGHPAGDKVLKAMAQTARRLLRETRGKAVGVRWGGEEFVLAFLGMDIKETEEISEELRKRIADEEFDIGSGKTIRKTISLGVAELEPDIGFEELFENADSAMYDAKNGGRNQVKVYDEQRSPA
jgi:dGTPase